MSSESVYPNPEEPSNLGNILAERLFMVTNALPQQYSQIQKEGLFVRAYRRGQVLLSQQANPDGTLLKWQMDVIVGQALDPELEAYGIDTRSPIVDDPIADMFRQIDTDNRAGLSQSELLNVEVTHIGPSDYEAAALYELLALYNVTPNDAISQTYTRPLPLINN
jgi:hypothetical protein